MTFTLTFWVCLAAVNPMCSPEADPTGPPELVTGLSSRVECEEYMGARIMHLHGDAAIYSPWVPRHTCAPEGKDL